MRFHALAVLTLALLALQAAAQDSFIPRAQDKPPGPPLSPQEAVAKMSVPEGFTVELVASEPDIVNPVAMTFDERGRVWITESFEYPRREPGPGRDCVKVCEDTDGDGKLDKFTVFAEGLNIPSGIAVGHGGVWVANSPDILFLRDTDGDDKADATEVVVTGFGRSDTHELPNSLTWGPDGYLYGLNGVFNPSHVVQDGKEFKFTCALFRIHPVTRKFELFCEGTSNPWGIAWDEHGSAFVSACVIDHLWHLTETGYYHRQGGPYPPFTWKIESIVDHKHQKAAYCGIHYFDSDAYPPEYRGKLYMGNIHGNCINSDELARDGSTYVGKPRPDFLSAGDVWFMPVVQKTGPDGCLYVLDWYDRYHCYQDANRDPKGIDRGHGRLYRVRYKDTPRAPKMDMAKESDAQLVARLGAGNDLIRGLARRVLHERLMQRVTRIPERLKLLPETALSDSAPRVQRLEALWTLISANLLNDPVLERLLSHTDATFRAWGVRAVANQGVASDEIRRRIAALAEDPSPEVRLQVAIAARKVRGLEPMAVLLEVLGNSASDTLIPHIVWQNLHPLLQKQSRDFLTQISQADRSHSAGIGLILPRAIDRMLAAKPLEIDAIGSIFGSLLGGDLWEPEVEKQCLALLASRVQSREIAGKQLEALKQKLNVYIRRSLMHEQGDPLAVDLQVLAASWKDEQAIATVRKWIADSKLPDEQRLAAIDALIAAGDDKLLASVPPLLAESANSASLRGGVLATLGRLEAAEVATIVLDVYPRLSPDLKPRAVELLTQRLAWSKPLVAEIAAGRIPTDALNVNQARKLISLGDAELTAAVSKHWGTVRTERDPKRDEFVAQMRSLLRQTPGDAHKGQAVFAKICGQCHKMHGQGQEVGPDITLNGRSSFDQLLSNVFDPSLVIGASYQARTVLTTDGRVLSGLLVEDNDQRVVLKQQGGKLDTIARDEVEEMKVSPLSLMPEGIEKQITPQEIADLFAFITLDKPPSDPTAKPIPGTKEGLGR